MNKCVCCGKDAAHLVKVKKIGMCCEHCAAVILMALNEKESDIQETKYEILKDTGEYVTSENKPVGEDALLFTVTEPDGTEHAFCVMRWDRNDGMSSLTAIEVYKKDDEEDSDEHLYGDRLYDREPISEKTYYEFDAYGPEEAEDELILELILKTVKGVSFKSLDNGYPNHTGEMEIVYICPDTYGWKIDGRVYSPEEMTDLFSGYEGWRICFQARARCDEELEKDTLLMPFVMNEDTFIEELKEMIMVFSEKNRSQFISYKSVPGFDTYFEKLINKLEFYFLNHPRGVGKIAGMKMINILKNIDTDDDMFPECQIQCIRDVISTGEEFNHPEIEKDPAGEQGTLNLQG